MPPRTSMTVTRTIRSDPPVSKLVPKMPPSPAAVARAKAREAARRAQARDELTFAQSRHAEHAKAIKQALKASGSRFKGL